MWVMMRLAVILSVDTLPFVASDDSPVAAPETPNNMDISRSEGAEGKAPNGGRQCGNCVPRWHHDSSCSHSARGQKSVLGVCHRWLWHWLWHIFWLDSGHKPVYHCAHQRVKRWRRWRGGPGRSVTYCKVKSWTHIKVLFKPLSPDVSAVYLLTISSLCFYMFPSSWDVRLCVYFMVYVLSVAAPVSNGDIEKGSKTQTNSNLAEILPVYRQDSHLSVNGGSHDFPGEGTYLLKFDNSYSLWRNKTLYYRVYYSAWLILNECTLFRRINYFWFHTWKKWN